MALPSNLSRAWVTTKCQYSFAHRGSGSVLLGGVIIDLKLLICFVLVVARTWVVRVLWLKCLTAQDVEQRDRFSQWFILAPTPVPYSAGVLWPTVSMCVHWTSDFFCIRDETYQRRKQQLQVPQRKPNYGDGRVIPFTASFQSKQVVAEEMRLPVRKYKYSAPTARINMNTFRYIQHQMKCLHGRSDDVEANVAFMNAVLMSDPIAYLRTVLGRDPSTELAYYQSLLRPRQVVLLPVVVVGDHNEYTGKFKLLRRVNASELTWPELVQCG